jgi:pteridine reductase
MELGGKVALVTGGAHRLGKAMSLALANAGVHVAVNYRSSGAAAAETVKEIEALGLRAFAYQADVGESEQVSGMVAAVRDVLGRIDILVNSASPFEKTPLPLEDISAWDRVLAASLHGAFYCANAVLPHMREQGGGSIVNIVDLSAWQPWRGFAAHSVAKAGLLALTRQLALELAPHIRVNAIAPGKIMPPQGYSDEQVARGARQNALGRWGDAQDVTQAMLYLLRADFVTGEVLLVDGGEHLGRFLRGG